MRRGFVLLLAATASWLHGEPNAAEGIRLYESHHYAEACAVLRGALAKEPANAEACHTLGLALLHSESPGRYDAAGPWLQKASDLVPGNSDYLADYAGNCLELARVHHSYSYATRGRDLMEKAVGLDPANLDGRYGLMRFYTQAPWPLGDREKSFAEAAEIIRRDPVQGRDAFLWLGKYLASHDRPESARRAYREVLQSDPHNAVARAALAQLK